MVRMVIGIADKFPALARTFYEAGAEPRPPAASPPISRRSARAGGSPWTTPTPPPGSSWACAAIRSPCMLLLRPPGPTPARVRSYAEAAVATFLAGYGPKG